MEHYAYGLSFVGEFAHKYRLLLWVDSPTPEAEFLNFEGAQKSIPRN
jgi:hypothetical protein